MKETPKYVIIADHFRQLIHEENFKVDDQLPQEIQIAKSFNVSRITVRKALDELEKQGLIYRVQGSGTFVKDANGVGKGFEKKSLDLFNLEEYQIEILNFEIQKTSKEMAAKLNINEYDLVYKIERILKQNDEIMGYQVIYLPSKVIQGIRLDVFEHSLYTFLEDELVLNPKTAIREISTVISDEKLNRILQITKLEPLLKCEQRTFLDSGQLFEWTRYYYRANKYKIIQHIKK